MKCPKCAYARQSSDNAPAWQCPSCKVAYIKVLQAQEAARAAALPAPSEDIELEAEERLWEAASGQKILLKSILLNVAVTGLGGAAVWPPLASFALFVCITFYALGGLARVGSGLGMSQGAKIALLVVAFFPILGVISIFYVSARATALLRRAGWTVGLLGGRP